VKNLIIDNKDFNKKQNNNPNPNYNSVNDSSVLKVTQGTIILFFGLMFGMLFSFISRFLFARFFTISDYGIFSLGTTIVSVFATIGTLGLAGGATRQIAYYVGKDETDKVHLVILWSFVIATLVSIIVATIIFLSSGFIAQKIFNMPNFELPLKIFSIAIPFLVLISILSSIFLGFKHVHQQIFFNNVLRNLLFPILLVIVFVIGLSYEWGIIANVVSIGITFVVFFVYFLKKKLLMVNAHTKIKSRVIGKELLIFSLPLSFVAISDMIITWTDTLMLGYFKTSDIVGLYNAAILIGGLISVSLTAMLFIYMPIVSELYAKNDFMEMRRSYYILTKWLCAVAFPLAILFVLFPKVILGFLFGEEYLIAGTVLQILAFGYFINTLLGPNGAALTAMGKTKFLMWATFFVASVNVVLNVFLIPKYGINGAAISTITSIVTINIIRSVKLYSISGIHSLRKNTLKPIIIGCIIIFVIYFIVEKFLSITYWMLPIIFILFIITYTISLLLSKSFDKEDIEMLLKIENKTGLKFTRLKRLMKRFI
jgi:O-antigen/teichoic acid export membrane protein